MVLLVLVDAEGREVNMGGKILKEGMELDTEQEGALPDTSGMHAWRVRAVLSSSSARCVLYQHADHVMKCLASVSLLVVACMLATHSLP